MPDPSVRYGSSLIRKEGSGNANPINLLNQLLRGNRQGQQLTGPNPGSVVSGAKKRSKGRTSNKGPGDMFGINQLEGMLGAFGGVSPADMDQLQAELRKAVAGQFDPQISGTKKSMSGAKKRAGAAKKEIGALYDELVGYYQGQVAPTKERSKQAKDTAQYNASALKQSITSDYATRIRDQVDEFKRLGIQAASPSATEGQDADRANALAMAETSRAAEESALNQQAEGDLGYWTEGSGIAKREGTEQEAGITQQLNAFLNEQDQQLEVLKGQKSAAYHTGLMNLQQEAAQAASQQQNELWNRMLELARLKLSAASTGGAGGSEDPGRGLSGALGFLKQSGAGSLGSTFQQYLAEAQRWASTPGARAMYGGAVDTPEEWAQVIRDNAVNKRQSGTNADALWQAALRYYGRG